MIPAELPGPGDRLFYHRTIRHIPVHELARRTGLTAFRILSMEAGEAPIDPDSARKLAAAIGIDPSRIL